MTMSTDASSLPQISWVGAGRLGSVLAGLLVQHQLAQVVSVCNAHLSSARAVVQRLGQGVACRLEQLLPADVLFLTVPDDKLPWIACQLAEQSPIARIVIHCSGVLGSSVLAPLKLKGASIVSIHPMSSFSQESQLANLDGIVCGVEGDRDALSVGRVLFEKLGASLVLLDPKYKPLCHAASVMASNYLITLAQSAVDCFVSAGLDDDLSVQVVTQLMSSALTNLKQKKCPRQSLTGPIQRADVGTIKMHISALREASLDQLYAILGTLTLPLTAHSDDQKDRLHEALCSSEG